MLSTAGSGVDTVLAVYTGTTLGDLVLMAGNDDDPNAGTTSMVEFPVGAGVAYHIAVDSPDGRAGLIRLSLEFEAVPVVLRLSLSGRNIVLSWPTSAAGFDLEFSETLTDSAWSRALLTPVINGEDYALKTQLGSGNRFYRLRGP